MAHNLQIRRGEISQLPTLNPGELGVALDEERLFVGGSNKNIELSTLKTTDSLSSSIHKMENEVNKKADLVNGKVSNDQLPVMQIPTVTTAGTSTAYTATVDGITQLTTGLIITIIPHHTSTSFTPTLNLNDLGAKVIKRNVSGDQAINTVSFYSGHTISWLHSDSPITVQYNGSDWIAVGLTKPYASDLEGLVPTTRGGTGRALWDTNRLIYPTGQISLGQMSVPTEDMSLLMQDKSGPPYWSSSKNLASGENPVVEVKGYSLEMRDYQAAGMITRPVLKVKIELESELLKKDNFTFTLKPLALTCQEDGEKPLPTNIIDLVDQFIVQNSPEYKEAFVYFDVNDSEYEIFPTVQGEFDISKLSDIAMTKFPNQLASNRFLNQMGPVTFSCIACNVNNDLDMLPCDFLAYPNYSYAEFPTETLLGKTLMFHDKTLSIGVETEYMQDINIKSGTLIGVNWNIDTGFKEGDNFLLRVQSGESLPLYQNGKRVYKVSKDQFVLIQCNGDRYEVISSLKGTASEGAPQSITTLVLEDVNKDGNLTDELENKIDPRMPYQLMFMHFTNIFVTPKECQLMLEGTDGEEYWFAFHNPCLYTHLNELNKDHLIKTKTSLVYLDVEGMRAYVLNLYDKENHITNNEIHVTEEDKNRWNSIAGSGGTGVSLGETSYTAYRGDRGKIAYDHSQVPHAPLKPLLTDIDGLQNALDSHTHSTFNPELITRNANLNDYTTPGFYYCPTTVTVVTLQNLPSGVRAFFLTVGKHAGTSQTIAEYTTNDPKTYFRNFYEGEWGPWHRSYTTCGKPAIADVTELQSALDGKEPLIKNAPTKTSLVDTDTMPLSDSVAANGTKKITFANIKNVLKTYFDTQYNNYVHPVAAGNKHLPAGGSANQVLQWESAGTAKWAEAPSSKSTKFTNTLDSSKWVYSELDNTNTYEISHTSITPTSIIEMIPPVGIAIGQVTALQEANIIGGMQTSGKIVLKAFGLKPKTNIPVLFIIRTDI